MAFALKYTSHLGYLPPVQRPQFLSTVGSPDVAKHIRFAASIGMSGVLYPWALERPADELRKVREALTETGLGCSCVVSVSAQLLATNIWTSRNLSSRQQLSAEILKSSKVAQFLGSTIIAVLIAAEPVRDSALQLDDVVENLREMADIASAHGITLGLEPMIMRPGMLLKTTRDALKVVRRVSRPNVKLIYDTAHVSMMDGDLMPPLVDSFSEICLVQIADQPGRVEPGSGTLDLVSVLAKAIQLGYNGFIDLEHDWRLQSAEGEAEGLNRIMRFDTLVRDATSGPA